MLYLVRFSIDFFLLAVNNVHFRNHCVMNLSIVYYYLLLIRNLHRKWMGSTEILVSLIRLPIRMCTDFQIMWKSLLKIVGHVLGVANCFPTQCDSKMLNTFNLCFFRYYRQICAVSKVAKSQCEIGSLDVFVQCWAQRCGSGGHFWTQRGVSICEDYFLFH